jgi:hypothetical protein
MNITNKTIIVDFLRGIGTDHIGRTYEDMIGINDEQMEKCHDQIQWMFPLHEFSKHARTCPVISPEIVEEALKYPSVQFNILIAKNRFEKFLAIGEHEDVDIQRKWCRDRNHNLLRVTRAIRCLRLFELKDEALDLFNKVVPVGERLGIGSFTMGKWTQALLDDKWNTLQD